MCLRAKGAETRNSVPFAVVLAQTMHERPPSARTRTIVACASALLDFYMIMSLETYDVQAGKEACRNCVTLYNALSKEAADDEASHRWRLTPKVHLFQELAEFQGPAHGNPRNFWTYADEDFVGWIVKIARSRGGGANQAGTAAARVMQRYRALGASG